MLKRLLPVLICLIFCSGANAQKKNVQKNIHGENTQRKKAAPYYKAGLALKQAGNFGEALNAFGKAISLDKKYDSAYVEKGDIYSGGGKMDTASINYYKALSINPNYTAALIGLGKIHRDATHDLDSALFYYNAAEQLDKKNKETYYALAWIYNAKKEYDRAIPYAVKSLEIDNTYKPAYGELGHAYRATSKWAECIEQFKKNLAVSVVDLALLYSGFCYLELKNKDGAMQQYEALLKVNEKMAAGLKKRIDDMK